MTSTSLTQFANRTDRPPIRQFMDIGTGHLEPGDRAFLDRSSEPSNFGGVAAMKGPYGWFVYAHDDRLIAGISDALWAIMTNARRLGCEYVLFDADAPTHPDLPSFDYDTGAPSDGEP
jgi:hypothetical protein